MNRLSPWFNARWDYWRNNSDREHELTRSTSTESQHTDNALRSKVRPRKLSISSSGAHGVVTRDCKLLTLPAELRGMIWDYLLRGNAIAIYRSNDRLTHVLLDDTNSAMPPRRFQFHYDSITKLMNSFPEAQAIRGEVPINQKRLYCLALLQSCRLM